MAAETEIAALIQTRGMGLTQADVDEIETLLATIPPPGVIEIEESVWEAVSLIVNDPLYRGDAKLPEYGED